MISTGGAFRQDYTSLEVLGGIHYSASPVACSSRSAAAWVCCEPGTPDGRVLFRLAYAPLPAEKPKDRDGDGIPDRSDACPEVAGVAASDARRHGCPPPPPDSDGDGLIDAKTPAQIRLLATTPIPGVAAARVPTATRMACSTTKIGA